MKGGGGDAGGGGGAHSLSAAFSFPSGAGRSLRSLGLRALRRAGAVAPTGPLRGPVPLNSDAQLAADRRLRPPQPFMGRNGRTGQCRLRSPSPRRAEGNASGRAMWDMRRA